MKKLKMWQIVLLIIFYPIGIIYLIVYLCKKISSALAANNVVEIISCSLVGCIYPNPDGTSRQTNLVKAKVGDDLIFKPTPTKEYPDTIGVFTKRGCIGVLPYQTLNKLRGLYAKNKASAKISEIEKSERGLFCKIEITIYG